MPGYKPPIYRKKRPAGVSSEQFLKDFPAGIEVVRNGVGVSNDGDIVRICYQYSKENCNKCIIDCAYRTRSKES